MVRCMEGGYKSCNPVILKKYVNFLEHVLTSLKLKLGFSAKRIKTGLVAFQFLT